MSQRTSLNFHIPNMVHTFINQSFKIFRVPVISVKTHGHALLYYPFQKSSSLPSPPLKIAIFWLNIYPSIFDFSSCPIVNLIDYNCDSMSLYLTVSRDNAGVDGDSSYQLKYLNSHICKREKLFTSLAFQSH